jgi:hypothetical protein
VRTEAIERIHEAQTAPIKQELKKLIEIQRLVEEDLDLGVPEAQATLETLYYFN